MESQSFSRRENLFREILSARDDFNNSIPPGERVIYFSSYFFAVFDQWWILTRPTLSRQICSLWQCCLPAPRPGRWRVWIFRKKHGSNFLPRRTTGNILVSITRSIPAPCSAIHSDPRTKPFDQTISISRGNDKKKKEKEQDKKNLNIKYHAPLARLGKKRRRKMFRHISSTNLFSNSTFSPFSPVLKNREEIYAAVDRVRRSSP